MEDSFVTVSFRIRKGDAKDFQYIADILHQAKKLKNPSIGLLAKTYLYAQVISLYGVMNRNDKAES